MPTLEASGFNLYKNLSFSNAETKVLIDYEQIKPKRHKYASSDSKDAFYFWERFDLPKEKGVYLVYDCNDECIYVGSTPKRKDGGIRDRFKEHLNGKFADYGFLVYCYKPTKITPNNILLLERTFISALNPIFNSDEPNNGRVEQYKRKNYYHYQAWIGAMRFNFYESRNSEVPRSVICVYQALATKYGKYMGNRKFNRGAVYANLVKRYKFSDSFDHDVYEHVLEKIVRDNLEVEEILSLAFVKKEMRNRKRIFDIIRNNFYSDGWSKS
ncbi:GIY-YIG nuclease family protein [Priestia megaterium]